MLKMVDNSILIEVYMHHSSLFIIVRHGKFTIEASAICLDEAWYPHYKIYGLENGATFCKQPVSVGFHNRVDATTYGLQQAIFDLDFGNAIPVHKP